MTPEHLFMAAHGLGFFDDVTLDHGRVRFEYRYSGIDLKYACDREYIARLRINHLLERAGLHAVEMDSDNDRVRGVIEEQPPK